MKAAKTLSAVAIFALRGIKIIDIWFIGGHDLWTSAITAATDFHIRTYGAASCFANPNAAGCKEKNHK